MKKLSALALAVLLLALGVWYSWDGLFGQDTPSTEPAPLLITSPPAGPVLEPHGSEAGAAPPEAVAVVPATTEPRHVLSLQLETGGRLMPGAMQVTTKPVRDMRPGESWDHKDFEISSQGDVSPHEADITALFAEHQQPMIELEIELDHPAYLPVRHRLKLGMAAYDAGENVLRHHAVVPLTRAATIAGRVVGSDGAPLGGAFVGAWPRTEGNYGAPIAIVETNEEGTYRLRTPGGRVYTVVAVKRGLQPERTHVRVDRAGGITCDDLVLDSGSFLQGSLLLNERPLVGAGVILDRAEKDESSQQRYTAWHANAAVELDAWLGPMKSSYAGQLIIQERGAEIALARAAGVTDAQGRFRLGGLTQGVHRLRVSSWIDAGLLHPALSAARVGAIEVPRSDLTVRIAASTVRFLVTSGGEPLDDASVIVTVHHPSTDLSEAERVALAKAVSEEDLEELDELRSFLYTKADGLTRAPLLVPPGIKLRLVASCRGFKSQVRTITSRAAGESWQEVVELKRPEPELTPGAAPLDEDQPEVTHGTLVLELKTPGGVLIPRCAIGLYAPGRQGPSPSSRRRGRSANNTYRFENIRPGSYRVVARPGGTWAGTEDFWLDAEAQVEIRVGKESNLVLTTRRGGRLRMWVQDASGRPCNSRCRVRNAAGERLAVGFVFRMSGSHGMGSNGLSSPGPNEVARALPAGRYVLEFSSYKLRDRNATQIREEVVLKAGELVDLRVELPDP